MSHIFGRWSAAIALLVLAVILRPSDAPAAGASPPELAAYGADLTQTSVSGLSSGGFMAVQFDVAYSKEVVGAGIIAGGPYYCAGLTDFVLPYAAAQTLCMQPLGPAPSAEGSWRAAQQFASNGLIDDPQNLHQQRIYIFSGTQDATVLTKVVDQTARFYGLAQVLPDNIKYVHNVAAGHAIITNSPSDLQCDMTASPFINDCDFEQSHQILRWIYGDLNPPSAQLTGKLLQFTQRPFDATGRAALSTVGYVYVPAACATDSCKIHVVFHGCLQDATAIGDRYVRTTGYNELADSNHIIVLYPQVGATPVNNPLGCWDFWGYTSDNALNADFYSREAPQMAAVMRMVQRLGAPRQ
jgi:poly(3-hydroxybutyrate) depolymerase